LYFLCIKSLNHELLPSSFQNFLEFSLDTKSLLLNHLIKNSGTELLQNVGLKFGNEARLHMLVDILINIICGKVFQLREAPFTDVSPIADLIIICMILSLTDVEDE
jgi:hypothetical protein